MQVSGDLTSKLEVSKQAHNGPVSLFFVGLCFAQIAGFPLEYRALEQEVNSTPSAGGFNHLPRKTAINLPDSNQSKAAQEL